MVPEQQKSAGVRSRLRSPAGAAAAPQTRDATGGTEFARTLSPFHRATLASILFLICLSLGYPTLNRYDIRTALPDSADYARIVTSGPQAARPEYRTRILVPYLAKPFAALARGHVGSWDPISFGLLCANSLFVAATLYLVVVVAFNLSSDLRIAILAACLYLLNFAVSNSMLAGMVDSAEAFFLMAAVALLLNDKWRLLPLVAIAGAAGKETFVVFLGALAAAWALSGARKRAALAWTIVSVVGGLATVTALFSIGTSDIVWPWSFAAVLNSSSGHFRSAVACATNRTFWYMFAWLLPLGLLKIRMLPRPWILGCVTASVIAILLSAYHNQPQDAGAAARPLFNIAGPLLSISAAFAVAPLAHGPHSGESARPRPSCGS